MKVIAKPIEMIVWFDKNGTVCPTSFKLIKEDSSTETIKIDKIIKRAVEKFAGNKMLVFTCQSAINGTERIYEIKYELGTCKWVLFKF